VADLHRTGLKEWVATKLREGLSRGYLKTIVGILQSLLSAAQEDGVIIANPATALGRQFKLSRTVGAKQDAVKAMTREQLAAFLTAAEQETAWRAPACGSARCSHSSGPTSTWAGARCGSPGPCRPVASRHRRRGWAGRST
jgi:hypothetical protein